MEGWNPLKRTVEQRFRPVSQYFRNSRFDSL
jgi:hypothetical protein